MVFFAHLSVKRGYKTFNLLLQNLHQFVDRLRPNTFPILDLTLNPNISPSHYIPDFYFTRGENCLQENLVKIMQALSCTINTTIEELEEYCYCKNIDPATLLSKKYHEWLDVFLKKEIDILPIHCLYNQAINIKDGYQLISAIMYGINRNKIRELRW